MRKNNGRRNESGRVTAGHDTGDGYIHHGHQGKLGNRLPATIRTVPHYLHHSLPVGLLPIIIARGGRERLKKSTAPLVNHAAMALWLLTLSSLPMGPSLAANNPLPSPTEQGQAALLAQTSTATNSATNGAAKTKKSTDQKKNKKKAAAVVLPAVTIPATTAPAPATTLTTTPAPIPANNSTTAPLTANKITANGTNQISGQIINSDGIMGGTVITPGNRVVISVGGEVAADYGLTIGHGQYQQKFFMPLSPLGTGRIIRLVVNGEKNDYDNKTRTLSYQFFYGGRAELAYLPDIYANRLYLYFGGKLGGVPLGIFTLGKDFDMLTKNSIDGSAVFAPSSFQQGQLAATSNQTDSGNNLLVSGYGAASSDNHDTSLKISYQSPHLYGFSLAGSFTPTASLWRDNMWTPNTAPATHKNIFSINLRFAMDLGDQNNQFLLNLSGGYQTGQVLPAYSASNHQFLDSVFYPQFLNKVLPLILNPAVGPAPNLTQATTIAQTSYQTYIGGTVTDTVRSLGYQTIAPAALGFGLNNQEAYHAGIRLGYNPLSLTRNIERFSADWVTMDYQRPKDMGDGRDNTIEKNMGDFIGLAIGVDANRIYGDRLSFGLNIRPLAFLSIYGGYDLGRCQTTSCQQAHFITAPATSSLWNVGLTVALARQLFIYGEAVGLSGQAFGQPNQSGYLYATPSDQFNKVYIRIGSLASF